MRWSAHGSPCAGGDCVVLVLTWTVWWALSVSVVQHGTLLEATAFWPAPHGGVVAFEDVHVGEHSTVS